MSDINRNPSDYDANIRSILHSAPGRAFSLDEISVYISTNIDGNLIDIILGIGYSTIAGLVDLPIPLETIIKLRDQPRA